MKTCTLLFCGLAGVFVTGCNHPIASGPGSTAIAPALTDATTMAVPLPAQTPFDGKPKARAAYLEFFAMGYRFGVTDSASAGCLCGSEGAAEYYEASMSGFLAGKEAGSAALAKERLQSQAPTTATAGTPTATPPPRQR
jgi:hypothetical protein